MRFRTYTYGRRPRRTRQIYLWFRRYTINLAIHEANRR